MGEKKSAGGRTSKYSSSGGPAGASGSGNLYERTDTEVDQSIRGGNPHTVLGRTVVVQGQLSAGEDLLIDGQFEGNISLDDHCLTVGTEGHVKAEIRARQIVILGSVTGNLSGPRED